MLQMSRDVEGVGRRRIDVDSVGFDGECCRNGGGDRIDDPNAQCRGRGPGGHLGELEVSKGVKVDGTRRTTPDGVGVDGRGCRMDGATSVRAAT